MSPDLEFILVVLGIAVIGWIIRSALDADPDPFILNLTLFAFAGQCIRTREFDGRFDGLFVLGLLFALMQVGVVSEHRSTTKQHYLNLLRTCQIKEKCPDSEVDHWASVLLRITGTDFVPGLYWWMFWTIDPRQKTREEAFSVIKSLPTKFFSRCWETIDAASLQVPASGRRRWLGFSYILLCVLSWGCFIVAITRELPGDVQSGTSPAVSETALPDSKRVTGPAHGQ